MKCWGVLPAAGIGRRFGASVPKQYLEIAGKTLLEHSLAALFSDARVHGVVVVLRAGDARAEALAALRDPRVLRAVGGAERADSVAAGLAALRDHAAAEDWVLVHDAARPCLDAASLAALIDAVAASGAGAILAQPVSDTVKRSEDGSTVAATMDRQGLWLAQTPQLFRIAELDRALAAAGAVTDEASAMEAAGYPVGLVSGPRTNIKITTAEDLVLARCLLAEGRA